MGVNLNHFILFKTISIKRDGLSTFFSLKIVTLQVKRFCVVSHVCGCTYVRSISSKLFAEFKWKRTIFDLRVNVCHPLSEVNIYIWLTVPRHHNMGKTSRKLTSVVQIKVLQDSLKELDFPQLPFKPFIYVVKMLFVIAFVFNMTLGISMLSNSRPGKKKWSTFLGSWNGLSNYSSILFAWFK